MTGVNASDNHEQRSNWETAAAKHTFSPPQAGIRQWREGDTQAIHQCCFIKIFIHTMLLYVGSDPRG